MLESLLLQNPNTDTLETYIDISFEDSELGSSDIVDKVSGLTFNTKLFTLSGAVDSKVIDHPEYGKVMEVNSGRMWWLRGIITPTKNLIIEVEFVLTANPNNLSSGTAFFSTGHVTSGSNYINGYDYTLRTGSYGYSLSQLPPNSGSSINKPVITNTLEKYFIETKDHSPTNRGITYGLRSWTEKYQYNTSVQEGTALYLFGWTSTAGAYPQLVRATGYLKSVKAYNYI